MQLVSLSEFQQEWLKDITDGNPSTMEKGRRFATKLIKHWLEIDDDSDDIVYCDGSGDGGIDIAYLQKGDENADNENESVNGDKWYLVQSKYGTAFRGDVTLVEESFKIFDTLIGKRTKLSSLAAGLVDRIRSFCSKASERDRLVIVFATIDPLNQAQKSRLEDIRALGREKLGSIFEVEAISIETIYNLLEQQENAKLTVPLKANLIGSGQDMLVGPVSLIEFYSFLKDYRLQTGDLDRLYEKNVRRFLGGRGKVNKGVMTTLKNTPELFGRYNNGITIVVSKVEQRADHLNILYDPYVVNGCQTTQTIWEVLHAQLESGGTGRDTKAEAWRERIATGTVVVKIVEVNNPSEVERITRYTNSQNAVRDKDFVALKEDFQTWKKQMEDHYKIYLEIQRGGWESQKAFQRQHPTSKPRFSEYANAFDLIKVYGAGWLSEPGLAFGKNAPFLPGGNVFQQIVNAEADTDPFGADDLYVAYRLHMAASNLGFGRGADKASRRQTRFLFYYVLLELLKGILRRASLPNAPKDLTYALVKLSTSEQTEAMDALLLASVDTIDEYLTQNIDGSVFSEAVFLKTFNQDLNGFLKWENLGKPDADLPGLRQTLATQMIFMGKSKPNQNSIRDLIVTAIK